MPDNICKFIFQKNDENDLYPLHLVLETHAQKFEKMESSRTLQNALRFIGDCRLSHHKQPLSFEKGRYLFLLYVNPLRTGFLGRFFLLLYQFYRNKSHQIDE